MSTKPTPTWHETLDLKPGVEIGTIWKMVDYAKVLGYTYFVWNDRVYDTVVTDSQGMVPGDTGSIVERSFIVGKTEIRQA